MKIMIFAGGTGRRLWPISRQESPKQFEPIIGKKSTLQLAVDRVSQTYGAENIYLSTNERYTNLISNQLPAIKRDHIIGEPERRDLAAAVGLAMFRLKYDGAGDEPVAIIWGDNYMTDEAAFLKLLASAEALLEKNLAEIVFLGETPRFANPNLGWIGLGDELGYQEGMPYYEFMSWSYRPDKEECQRMFDIGTYVWNTGYFVTRPNFVINTYEQFQPTMWTELKKISATFDTLLYDETLHSIYPKLEVHSFDDAIVRNIALDKAVVLSGSTGWSDPGTLYALKEAISRDPQTNVEKGLVKTYESHDCLLYNYDEGKLLAAVGLEGMIVVNTEDALLVVHKDNIGSVKKLVNELIGTELEKYS